MDYSWKDMDAVEYQHKIRNEWNDRDAEYAQGKKVKNEEYWKEVAKTQKLLVATLKEGHAIGIDRNWVLTDTEGFLELEPDPANWKFSCYHKRFDSFEFHTELYGSLFITLLDLDEMLQFGMNPEIYRVDL
jgi:hypothetical protein